MRRLLHCKVPENAQNSKTQLDHDMRKEKRKEDVNHSINQNFEKAVPAV